MKKNNFLLKPLVVILLSCLFLLVIVFDIFINHISAVAQEIDYLAENRARDFLIALYDAKDVNYSQMKDKYSVCLYDDEDNIIAQVSLFDRDGKVDYAVYNYITESIDEYGFDCDNALIDFPAKEKIYYAGIFDYYSKSQNQIKNTSSGEVVESSSLSKKIRSFKEKMQKQRNNMKSGSNKPNDAEDGIINWKDIQNRTSGWTNSSSGYLNGITWGSTTDTNGINGSGLSFSSMASLSKGGTITNHCGPTALTNIMVYYDWLGMNTLLNNSRQDTFDVLRSLCSHDKYGTTYIGNARNALKIYMYKMGYNVALSNFDNSFDSYKSAIDANKVVLTLLNVTESNGNKWGHFVVTLGYEEFKQPHEIVFPSFGNMTITVYSYLRYIRVCNGWDSRNQNRFVDLNNFFDSYTNSAITII